MFIRALYSCVCMGVCAQACGWCLLVHYTSCASICVSVYAYKYMHTEGSLRKETFWTGFQNDVIQPLREMSVSPESI